MGNMYLSYGNMRGYSLSVDVECEGAEGGTGVDVSTARDLREGGDRVGFAGGVEGEDGGLPAGAPSASTRWNMRSPR